MSFCASHSCTTHHFFSPAYWMIPKHIALKQIDYGPCPDRATVSPTLLSGEQHFQGWHWVSCCLQGARETLD